MSHIRFLSDQDEVETPGAVGLNRIMAVSLAHAAFAPIADHRVAKFFAGYKCDKATGCRIGECGISQIHGRCGQSVAFSEQAVEMGFAPENLRPG
jgi:hypothetical protein